MNEASARLIRTLTFWCSIHRKIGNSRFSSSYMGYIEIPQEDVDYITWVARNSWDINKRIKKRPAICPRFPLPGFFFAGIAFSQLLSCFDRGLLIYLLFIQEQCSWYCTAAHRLNLYLGSKALRIFDVLQSQEFHPSFWCCWCRIWCRGWGDLNEKII